MRRIFKRGLGLAIALTLVTALIGLAAPTGAQAVTTYAEDQVVVGYYAGWAAYQGFHPDQIQGDLLTHINYAFADIDPQKNALVLGDPGQDQKNLSALRTLRKKYPHLKLLISVGGWDYSAHFSDVASTASRRSAFAESCVQLIVEQGLDGIDLDWEYPVSGGLPGTVHRPQDKQNFTLLLQAIRDKLDQQSKKDGKTYYLTIAGAASTGYLNNIEVSSVAKIVDHIFLMAYDMHGPWDSYADLNAPLYTPKESSPQYKTSVDSSIRAYLNRGVPASKLVLGMPLYGYRYQGVKAQNNGLYSTFSSAASVPYYKIERDYLSNSSYRKLCHTDGKVPYLYGNGTFLSYDDADSMQDKGELARSYGLGGIGFWELSQDRKAVLMQSACAAFAADGWIDVPKGAWYAEAAQYVREKGLMTGTSAVSFSPNASVTRGMLAVILHRMEGTPAAGKNSFSDVAEQSYCRDAVAWADAKGIMNGYGDGRFGPNHPVTREQIAAVLFRYAKWKGLDVSGRASLSGFSDAGKIADFAREPMAWAVRNGLITGRTNGTIDPVGTATRAETAVILMRFCEEIG